MDPVVVAVYRLLLAGEVVELCGSHPAYLLDRVERMVDEKTGESFQFELTDPGAPWFWQRGVLDGFMRDRKTVVLKARQLGITWLAGGYGLWTLLYRPGTRVMVYRQTEDEAAEVVGRIWDLLESLPGYLWNGAVVLKPARGSRPHTDVELRFPDGRVSTLSGMASTSSAGHGKTAALVILDEAARIERLRDIWKAITPVIGRTGRVVAISTANGVSNPQSGEGNFFHRLWVTADEKRLTRKFLGWDCHPDRDQDWYDSSDEVQALDSKERAEQYPSNADEAFILTGDVYFDVEALAWYATNAVREPLGRFDFVAEDFRSAKLRNHDHGKLRVYEEPRPGGAYAIGADSATGRGKDSSAAYVIDLSNMALVAEFHGKLDADLYATQLHYLGRWYNTAWIAIENQGGYGEAVIIPLRDGRAGRPAYPKLYRHVHSTRPDLPTSKPFGFPMSVHTRPLVVNQIEKAIRDKHLPWMTSLLMGEARTFVTANTPPSPRAQEGCNDDCVMACAIALEMYRLYGHHANRQRKHPKAKRTVYPWQRQSVRRVKSADPGVDSYARPN